MRKLYILITILAVLLLSACGQSATSESENASSDKVIKIGASPDGYPQYYMEDDELKGFSVDVIEKVFGEIGYEVEWVLADWAGLVASLETGKIDTLSNFAVTPEREEKYSFADPYFYSRVGIGVAKDNNTINSLEDLKGKKVANVLGSNYGEVLKQNDANNEIEIVNYEALDVIYQDVASGKIDAFVSGRELLLSQTKDKGIPLKVTGESFGEKPVALPFKKTEENEKLIAEINKVVEKLKADGTLKEISEKWFGEDVTVSVNE